MGKDHLASGLIFLEERLVTIFGNASELWGFNDIIFSDSFHQLDANAEPSRVLAYRMLLRPQSIIYPELGPFNS